MAYERVSDRLYGSVYCSYGCEDKHFQGQMHSVSQSTTCGQGHAVTLKGRKSHTLYMEDGAVIPQHI